MKLLTLQMKNFRQFLGETIKVKLAEGDRNVTIIHGANGAGKTTILNALTWLVYNRFTDAFAAQDFLVNKRAVQMAKSGERVECWVELMFEHHSRKYVVRRTKYITKTTGDRFDDGPTKVYMEAAGEDGRWKGISDEDIPEVIGRILPEKLLPYFFFDGERIESSLRASKQTEVISATTMLVGEEVINRAIDHLDGARKKLEAELKQIGDAETTHLLERQHKFENEAETLQDKLRTWTRNLDGYRKQKQTIEEQLRALKSVQELQKRRDLLTEQQEELEQQWAASRASLCALVSNQGYQAYLHSATERFREIIQGLRKQGELPASIKITFVEELLRTEKCICGRPLHHGDHARTEVEKWLERGGMTDVEEAALRMEAEMNNLDREVPKLFERLDVEQQNRARYKEQLSKIEVELKQIRDELTGSSEENARDLEYKLTAVEDAMDMTRRNQMRDEEALRVVQGQLEDLEKEVTRRKGVTEAQQLASRRLAGCRESTSVLQTVRTKLRTNFRLDLMERINHLFSKMSFKPYRAILDQNYVLSLVDGPNDTPVGASTGESALLSLSFIGGVISQARELTSRRDRLPGPDSSVFPIVMDSPFGNLDPVYRRQVAKHIPELANQVVIMASKTQFQGEVENTMHTRIGKEYVLRYHSPKADAHEDRIERYGVPYDLVKRSPDEYEWTEIVEVTRHG